MNKNLADYIEKIKKDEDLYKLVQLEAAEAGMSTVDYMEKMLANSEEAAERLFGDADSYDPSALEEDYQNYGDDNEYDDIRSWME